LTITNSTFNKNTANRYGGAVYTQGSVTINQCVFTDNSASAGDAIYAYGGTATIENSIILEDGNAISRYESTYSDPATVTANDNW
jgi:predicted outer membrane repeat protein